MGVDHGDFALHRLDDLADNPQSHTEAGLPLVSPNRSFELAKDAFLVARRNTRPVIPDFDDNAGTVLQVRDRDEYRDSCPRI